eukprot:1811426-Alexandrium_andersonii.AAC.1
MSASLVGSEMCIRDRTRGISSTPLQPPVRGLEQWGAMGQRGDTTCPRAVSYTHLTLPTICSV